MPAAIRETSLHELLCSFASPKMSAFRFLMHPRTALLIVVHAIRLPVFEVALQNDVEVQAVIRGLSRRAPIRLFVHEVTAVLEVPADVIKYSEGGSKQTLRRKVRAARKAQIHWARVDDPQERRRLLDLANEYDRTNPREQYRHLNPVNSDLLAMRLWFVAYASDERPLLVSVVPTNGEWALLRYFRTLENSIDASLSRYLMTQVLVEELSIVGVRHLADNTSPMRLPGGLLHFQRMVGFRLCRVKFRRFRR